MSIFLPACAVQNVSPPVELISSAELNIAEDELLDIAVSTFSPLDEFTDATNTNILNLREAEALYASWHLAKTLDASKHWGAIHVTPENFNTADIRVSGKVLQSDGQTMRLQVKVEDSSGQVWFERPYLQVLNESYPLIPKNNEAPFQPLYSQVANDIRNYATDNLSRERIITIRNISRILFATRFAPERYESFLEPAGNGQVEINRMPANNDDVFKHINKIRIRHDSFLGALQDQYAVFINQVDNPYRDFIRLGFRITQALNDIVMQNETDRRRGEPTTSRITENPLDDFSVFRMPGSRTGSLSSRSNSLNSGSRRSLYASNLALSGQVFEQKIAPITVQVNNRSVELSGTVDEQYQQWQQLLQELIELEVGRDLLRPE